METLNMKDYLVNLPRYLSEKKNTIIVYNDKQIESDSNITKVKINGEYKCPDGYIDGTDNSCLRTINRSFYSNIKMISKSKL